MQILRKKGTGRVFVLLIEEHGYASLASALFEVLAEKAQALLVVSTQVGSENWGALTNELLALLRDEGLRQVSLVAFGTISVIAQNLCLQEQRLVRTLVLVDAATRAHADRFSRIIDLLEKNLPMGLPFRSRLKGFDSRPFLQRIRCPVLVVTSSRANVHEIAQARILSSNLSTAWLCCLSADAEGRELERCILEFAQIPARCPQKAQRSLQ